MKVLHLISGVAWRGGEQQVEYLFRSQADPIEKYLFCPEGSELARRNISNRLIVYNKRWGFDPMAALRLKKICELYKIDLLHLHDSHAINTFLLADIFGLNKPVIVHRHVNFPVKSCWKYRHRKIKKIICSSKAVEATMQQIVRPENTLTIHPGIPRERFLRNHTSVGLSLPTQMGLPDGARIIGMVAALEPEKNIGELVAIARLLLEKNKDFYFIVAGEGSQKNKWQSFLQESGLANYIRLMGFINDIPGFLSLLDVFLFTSTNEGLGQALLEAMAAGVPIVSTGTGGIRDIILPGETGLLYSAGNPGEAAGQITRIFEDPVLRADLIKGAGQFVQQFDISLMVDKVEKIYREIGEIA